MFIHAQFLKERTACLHPCAGMQKHCGENPAVEKNTRNILSFSVCTKKRRDRPGKTGILPAACIDQSKGFDSESRRLIVFFGKKVLKSLHLPEIFFRSQMGQYFLNIGCIVGKGVFSLKQLGRKAASLSFLSPDEAAIFSRFPLRKQNLFPEFQDGQSAAVLLPDDILGIDRIISLGQDAIDVL
ncbi:MAG: hypothetical protein IJI38_10480 [Clostridia bacterium]|nr:hypothetical protein [Clostridia bacterium]